MYRPTPPHTTSSAPCRAPIQQPGTNIICAHYDATGVRSAGGWDWQRDPAPGADDNASGVALVLESARLLAGQQFPWSIRFIAWSGEELGLLGSQAYADLAAERDDNILGVLNFDMIGFNDLQQRLELVTNPGSQWLANEMVAAAERYGIGLAIDVFEDPGSRISDHAPFWRQGYDAIVGIENHLPADPDDLWSARRGLSDQLAVPHSRRFARQPQLGADTPHHPASRGDIGPVRVRRRRTELGRFHRRPSQRPRGRSSCPRQQHRAGRGGQQFLGAGFTMRTRLQPVYVAEFLSHCLESPGPRNTH